MSNDAGRAHGGPLASPSSEKDVGPDPVIGAGITLLGIFLMGVGGAAGAHYLFNFGVLIAVLGAVLFVLFVTLTALQQRRALEHSGGTPVSPPPRESSTEQPEPPA
jgi:hypothetical protein